MSSSPKCPICGKAQEAKWRPFCSRRCGDVDLSRWLKGSYAVPAEEPFEDLDDEEVPAPGPPKARDD